jgi:hypothetical protein
MTKPNVYVDPEKESGRSMYEHAADRFDGADPHVVWPAWDKLSSDERAKWARLEKESYGP